MLLRYITALKFLDLFGRFQMRSLIVKQLTNTVFITLSSFNVGTLKFSSNEQTVLSENVELLKQLALTN